MFTCCTPAISATWRAKTVKDCGDFSDFQLISSFLDYLSEVDFCCRCSAMRNRNRQLQCVPIPAQYPFRNSCTSLCWMQPYPRPASPNDLIQPSKPNLQIMYNDALKRAGTSAISSCISSLLFRGAYPIPSRSSRHSNATSQAFGLS